MEFGISEKIRIPARPLFELTATGMGNNVLRHRGIFGTRIVSSPHSGFFRGELLSGIIAPGLANEWQMCSDAAPGVAHIHGLITLIADNGDAILMKYLGRRGPRYGENSWRIAICFEASADGAHDWMNDVTAVGRVDQDGDDLAFRVWELLGRNVITDEHALEAEPLYELKATNSVGERYVVKSPIGGRYLTIAEGGCETSGRLKAHWPTGFAWGAHRTALGDGYGMPFHIDLEVELVADNGEMILQHYIGTNSRAMLSPDPNADRSWRTVAVFEAPAQGPLSYLNDVVALGVGWIEDDEANYVYCSWLGT